MGRPQIQEEAVVQLADLIQEKNPAGWPGPGDATTHYCMAWRGVKDMNSRYDQFHHARRLHHRTATLRKEFLSLIPMKD